jgi:acyl-CoA synthetase (AMP-forming)/AMP-acid ligase II
VQFNLADLFECAADTVPERSALVAGPARLTYRELDEAASRAAHGLAALGVGPGVHVGLALPDGVEHVAAMLGCYKLRAVPVNVNHRYTGDELAYLAADAGLGVLLYPRRHADRVRTLRGPLLLEVDDDAPASAVPRAPLVAGAASYAATVAGRAAGRDFGPRAADDEYLLYTGGTTGMPKGVVWRQEDIFFAALGGGNPGGVPIDAPEQLAASILAHPAGRVGPLLAPDEPAPALVTMALGPLVHASGQWSVLGTVLGGGTAVLFTELHQDPARVLDLVAAERVVALNLVGDAIARPLVEVLEAAPDRWDTSSLLMLGSGGSILSGAVKDRLLAALPSVRVVIDGIGSSESPAQAVAVTTRGAGATQSLRFAAKPTTMVVDDDLRPIPAGSGRVGRLATTGRVPLRYHGDPERSAHTFVTIEGRRWALPGDMATIDADGTVHLLGRGAGCINTGGEKVFAEEVEAVLKAHALVADAVVVGAPDPRWGERVVAIVAPRGGSPTLAALQEHCRAHLAGYKVPRALELVERVERLANGKVDAAWVGGVRDGL